MLNHGLPESNWAALYLSSAQSRTHVESIVFNLDAFYIPIEFMEAIIHWERHSNPGKGPAVHINHTDDFALVLVQVHTVIYLYSSPSRRPALQN